MRKKRDADGTRKNVLEAAELLFAEKGFNGTSIADISNKSGISSGLILYHFKSKSSLYAEVLEMISGRYAGMLADLRASENSPKEMMNKSLDAIFGFWKTDKTYQRINLWTYLEGTGSLADNESGLTAGLAAYLTLLQKEGVFPKNIPPLVFLNLIIGPIHFWFRYKKQFTEILQIEKTEEEVDAFFLENFKKIITDYFN